MSSATTPEEALVAALDAWSEKAHVPSGVYKSGMDVALHLRKLREVNHALIQTSMNLIAVYQDQRTFIRMKLKKEARMKKEISHLIDKNVGKTMKLRSGRHKPQPLA